MRTDDGPIIVEQTFNRSIDTVWNSITEIDQMRRWFFENIPSFKPEVGFETQFNVRSQGRDFLHVWKVTEVVPLKMIKYDWRYDGYPGDSYVVFELFEQNNQTKLKMTHQVKESFPEDIPEFSRESCIEGWTFFVKKRLKEFLEKDD
ncbi:MAG: SRPBCC domain-containing protein [Candidatus Latescibacterota bacterium]|nr:MAG: SRPBCC domain-containing protein [Candidatus Latescibacterota bacterium]